MQAGGTARLHRRAAPSSRDLAEIGTHKIGMGHGDGAIDEPNHHLRSPAALLHQGCQANYIQRGHRIVSLLDTALRLASVSEPTCVCPDPMPVKPNTIARGE